MDLTKEQMRLVITALNKFKEAGRVSMKSLLKIQKY